MFGRYSQIKQQTFQFQLFLLNLDYMDNNAIARSESPAIYQPVGNPNLPGLLEERFQEIIAEVEDYAIILLDKGGHILSWNKGAQNIKGYSAHEIIGRSYKIFYPKEDIQSGLPDTLLSSAEINGKVNHEGWRVRKNGTRFWGSITITALHDKTGSLYAFLKVTLDLTERKIVEEKLSNSIEELTLKNEELKREEERYHKMVSEVQDYAIILLDPDGKILDWNKGAEKLKGYTPQEIIGKNFRLFYPKEDKQSNLPQRLLQEAITQGSATHEGYRIRKNGSRFWGSIAITALHNDEGKVIGFSKVTRDLSDRKEAEDRLTIFTLELQQKNEELKQSEIRYQRMVGEVQDYAIILLDSLGNIQNWNAGAQVIKGYTAQEAIGKNFKMFYTQHDVDIDLPETLIKEAEARGRAMNEGWRKRKDGTLFWASVVITALHDTNGKLIGFSKVTRDLTERKKNEDALRESALNMEVKNSQLERVNTELSSFAYVVSHDLKEPIRKIQIFAGRQLEPTKSMDQILQLSEKIIFAASRMQSMMESLLAYALITDDSTAREMVDLNTILTGVEMDLEMRISESKAKIKSEKLPSVLGISVQLHQLFINLLSNALKFSQKGIAPEISITVKVLSHGKLPQELIMKRKEYYQLTFSDNGIGFEANLAQEMFNVFRRLQNKNGYAGTGVGLAIVKRVVENHDGMVVAQSEVDRGAQFHVYLPVASTVFNT